MMFNLRVFFCLIFFGMSLPGYCNNHYWEYWQRFNMKVWEKDSWTLYTYGELRTGNPISRTHTWLFSEMLSYEIYKNIFLGINYTYINSVPISENSPWTERQRIELECNPRWDFCCLTVRTRNRFETIFEEANPRVQYRLRQRTMLYFPFCNFWMKGFAIHNELFYDFNLNRINQDRFVPAQLTFALSEKIDLDIFFMLRFFLHQGSWNNSAVLGSQFNF